VPLLIVGTRHDRYLPVKDALTCCGARRRMTSAPLSPGRLARLGVVETAPRGLGADAVAGWIRAHADALRRRRFGKNVVA
jgi:hypothetical protein